MMGQIPVGTICIVVADILEHEDDEAVPIGSYCTIAKPLQFLVWDDGDSGFVYECDLPGNESFWALPEELHPLYPPPERVNTNAPREIETPTIESTNILLCDLFDLIEKS